MSKAINFYRDEMPNNEGVTLSEMMKFSLDRMEADHAYIQWMFPSNELSMFNGDAPLLTKEECEVFQSDPVLVEKLSNSFSKFLNFLGFELQNEVIVELEPTEQRPDPQWWLREFNHNMLRVTRVLKATRLLGLEAKARVLYNHLKDKECFSENVKRHWNNAVNGDLWLN